MKRIGLSLTHFLVIAFLISACAIGSSATATEPLPTQPPATQPPPTEPPTEPPATTPPLTNAIGNPTAGPTLAPGENTPPEPPPTEPLVRFANNESARNSAVVFDLRPYTSSATGILVGWMLDDAGTPYKMGMVQAGVETQFVDSEGRDLFGLFSGALVTIEESDQATEPGVIALQGNLPASLVPGLRELAVKAATPTGQAFDPGFREQATVLQTHGGLLDDAAKANDYPGMRQHAEHVVNITVGQNNPQYGDLDGNGQTENPGDGFGMAEYGNGLISLLDQVLESPESSERRLDLARRMRQCVVNGRNYATDLVGLAQSVLAAPDPASALVNTDQILQYTAAAHDGFDQNGNGVIEYVPLECGAAQAYQLCKPLTAIEMKPAGG